jgi:hypothetical protein
MVTLISSSNKYYKFWDGYNIIVSSSLWQITNTYKLGLIGFFLSLIKIIEKHKTQKYLLQYFPYYNFTGNRNDHFSWEIIYSYVISQNFKYLRILFAPKIIFKNYYVYL